MKKFKRMTFKPDQAMKILACLGNAKYNDSNLSDEDKALLKQYTEEVMLSIANRYKVDWSKEEVDVKTLEIKQYSVD